VRRLQFDTYEREIERYGGTEGMALAEQVFQCDSDAALEILDQLEPGDAGLDERWRLTLCSMHAFITDFGLDLATKSSLMNQLRKAYEAEFGVKTLFRIQLGDRFRKEKRDLEALLDPEQRMTHPLAPGLAIFEHRSARLTPVIANLRACEQAGRLSEPLSNLVASFLHMTANRLLRSAQRTHELVLYDFLARIFESQSKRQ
jgi:thiopeptide-type bacteriocin biosynthesis protein